MAATRNPESNPPGQHVRSATPADLDLVVECQSRCWVEAYTGIVSDAYLTDPGRLATRRTRWAAHLAGDRQVMIAVGSVTPNLAEGVVSFGPSRDVPAIPDLELMSLYVRARWHGSGLADRLLDAAIGEDAASLWVFVANPRAQAFYRRHGFEPDGIERLDVETDLVELRMVR